MDFTHILVTGISAISASLITYLKTKGKDKVDLLSVEVSRDEAVLDHYDKIVSQLQAEVETLRKENEELRRHNMMLERDMLEMNRHVFAVSKELSDLKDWVNTKMKGNTPPTSSL